MTHWSTQDSSELYSVTHWGNDYFFVGENGHLNVQTQVEGNLLSADLFEVASQIGQTGIGLPVLLRVTNILHDRTTQLIKAFGDAISDYNYLGTYLPVYPIKVNQQRTVVENIINHPQFTVGLEAGSKPELSAVLAFAPDGGTIVCNGYKDREYIRLALCGLKMGYRIFVVVEKLSELSLVLDESKKLGVTPLLGVRVRLASIAKGNWQNTGGDKSKFGLSAPQLLLFLETLKQHGLLDSLKLLHCHLGSQLSNIRDIQAGIKEFTRYFTEISSAGATISHVDVGGGLGIDYEGTRSRSFCSTNYTLGEYASAIVQALWETCHEHVLPHPTILTESGRAMTAHHAMLLANVVDHDKPAELVQQVSELDDQPFIIQNLWYTYSNIESRALPEIYHDATHYIGEAYTMYTHGLINLQQRAHAEELFFAICRKLRPLLQHRSRIQREILEEINDKLAEKYFCNLSIFQSLPDIWAINQIFPIMPLHRLNEMPTQHATLHDLTCDSDGAVKQYVDKDGIVNSLPLHPLVEGEPYILGFFLVGAYQEILGDMHNLFGDTHSINVTLTDKGFELSEQEEGDTVEEVLRYVHIESGDLLQAYREKLKACDLKETEHKLITQILQDALSGYTYFEEEL